MAAVTWIIDGHVARRRGLEEPPLAAAARAHGDTVWIVRDVGGDAPLDDVDFSALTCAGPVVLRGACGFVARAQAVTHAVPGGFLHAHAFHLAHVVEAVGVRALNHGLRVLPFGEVLRHRATLHAEFGRSLFLKPADGSKAFTGLVVSEGQPIDHAHFSKYRSWDRPADAFPVIVAAPRQIDMEHRVVLADGKPIASSQYRRHGRLDLDHPVPQAVLETAAAVARDFSPQIVHVADYAETPDGIKLIEVNQFGSSGLYACDERPIVEAVSDIARRLAPI